MNNNMTKLTTFLLAGALMGLMVVGLSVQTKNVCAKTSISVDNKLLEPDGTQTPIPTQTPEGTQTPESTQVPDSTQTPIPTQVPESTQIPMATQTPIVGQSAEATTAPSNIPKATKKPNIDSVLTEKTFLINAKKLKNNKLRLSWTIKDDCFSYKVYMKTKASSKKRCLATVRKGWYDVGKLKLNTSYTFYVEVYYDNKKIVKSVPLNIKLGNDDFMDISSITVKMKKITLTKKQYHTVRCKVLTESKLPILKKVRLQYYSNNKKVAKVDKRGTISVVKKGKAAIFVLAPNGVYDLVYVTVK